MKCPLSLVSFSATKIFNNVHMGEARKRGIVLICHYAGQIRREQLEVNFHQYSFPR
jgi:hypothetical protein